MPRSSIKKYSARFFCAIGLLLMTACSAPRLELPAAEASRAQLDAFLVQYPALDVQAELAEFLRLSEQMQRFTETYVKSTGTAGERINDLFTAIDHPSHKIHYKADAHYSAAQAFALAEANCLSYSAMAVALARAAKLRVYFQQVELPPSWSLGEKDLLLRFGHVNVVATTAAGRKKIIDFRLDRFSHFYPSRRLSDQQALALQFNNLAVEAMFSDDWPSAFRYLHSALIANPEEANTWANLGLALRRTDRLALAERAYIEALRLDHKNYSIMSNLAHVYRHTGRIEEAQVLSNKSAAHRERNPYYHFANAQRDFKQKNFSGALASLKVAQSLKEKEGNFAQLEAIIYWQQGQHKKAIEVMQLAHEWELSVRTSRLIKQRLTRWQQALRDGVDRQERDDM